MSVIKLQSSSPVQMKHGLLDFSFELNPGMPLGLMGANGVGKSTLIQYFKMHQDELFAGKRGVFLDQFPFSPLGSLSLKDLLHLLFDFYGREGVFSRPTDFDLIETFGFTNLFTRPINFLSGGQNQIAKILAFFYVDGDVLFLDEPTANLDAQRLEVFSTMLKREIAMKKYVLLVDHNKQFLEDFAVVTKEMVEVRNDFIGQSCYQLR